MIFSGLNGTFGGVYAVDIRKGVLQSCLLGLYEFFDVFGGFVVHLMKLWLESVAVEVVID